MLPLVIMMLVIVVKKLLFGYVCSIQKFNIQIVKPLV
jgi:hypothetical protein